RKDLNELLFASLAAFHQAIVVGAHVSEATGTALISAVWKPNKLAQENSFEQQKLMCDEFSLYWYREEFKNEFYALSEDIADFAENHLEAQWSSRLADHEVEHMLRRKEYVWLTG